MHQDRWKINLGFSDRRLKKGILKLTVSNSFFKLYLLLKTLVNFIKICFCLKISVINLFMQTPILNARVNDLLPVILDYRDFTNEPQTKKLTEKIMDFYAPDHHGIADDSTIILNHVSQVRLHFC